LTGASVIVSDNGAISDDESLPLLQPRAKIATDEIKTVGLSMFIAVTFPEAFNETSQ
jgi:hypothetical protein